MSVINQLFRLQELDLELTQIKGQLGGVLQAQTPPDSLEQLRSAAADAAEQLKKLRAQQRDEELTLGSLEGKIALSNDRLYSGKVRNPKELEDLQTELQSLQRRKSTLEDQMLETMIALEEADETEQQTRTASEEADQGWESKLSQLKADQQSLALQMHQMLQKRQSQAEAIPEKQLKRYDQLRRAKKGVAIALVKNDTCSGCQVGLTNNVLRSVRIGEETECPSCGRLLLAL